MIKTTQLNFHYPKKDWLFKGLNLEIPVGRICGVLGKNGVGKTSLLRILAGLLFPQDGDIKVLNYLPKEREPNFLQEIYFLPEAFELPNISATKYVKLYSPFYPRFKHDTFLKNAEEFELNLKKDIEDYSYGQKKKFLLAFCLASDCKILLLDEPSNGLDIPGKKQFRKLIASNFSEDKIFVISTHQIHDVEMLIDTVIILENGKILLQKPLEEISKKLSFMENAPHDTLNPQQIIYQEKLFGGTKTIAANDGDNESLINLEILFNAVLAHPEQINAVFSLRRDR